MFLEVTQPKMSVFGRIVQCTHQVEVSTMPVGKRRSAFSAKPKRRAPLPPAEATKLRDGAKDLGRHGFRDWVLLMMMYRHGLRVGEAVDIKWEQVDLQTGKLHVNRLKNGDASVHFDEHGTGSSAITLGGGVTVQSN
jgi:integrase